jgi:hypothetical protein
LISCLKFNLLLYDLAAHIQASEYSIELLESNLQIFPGSPNANKHMKGHGHHIEDIITGMYAMRVQVGEQVILASQLSMVLKVVV